MFVGNQGRLQGQDLAHQNANGAAVLPLHPVLVEALAPAPQGQGHTPALNRGHVQGHVQGQGQVEEVDQDHRGVQSQNQSHGRARGHRRGILRKGLTFTVVLPCFTESVVGGKTCRVT